MGPTKEDVKSIVEVRKRRKRHGGRSQGEPKLTVVACEDIPAKTHIGFPAGKIVLARRLWAEKKTAPFPVSLSHSLSESRALSLSL